MIAATCNQTTVEFVLFGSLGNSEISVPHGYEGHRHLEETQTLWESLLAQP